MVLNIFKIIHKNFKLFLSHDWACYVGVNATGLDQSGHTILIFMQLDTFLKQDI